MSLTTNSAADDQMSNTQSLNLEARQVCILLYHFFKFKFSSFSSTDDHFVLQLAGDKTNRK